MIAKAFRSLPPRSLLGKAMKERLKLTDIETMLGWRFFFNPAVAAAELPQASAGDVAGVGVSLGVDVGRDLPLIVGVESGTPAAEAGLQVQ